MIDLEAHIKRVVSEMDPTHPELPKLLSTLSFVENKLSSAEYESRPVLSEADVRARDLGIYMSRFLTLIPEEVRLDHVVPGSMLTMNEEWSSILAPFERRDKSFIVRSLNVARRHGSRIERGQREVFPTTFQP